MKIDVPNWLCFKCAYCVPNPDEATVDCMRLWDDGTSPPEDYFSICPGYASKVTPDKLDWFKHNRKFGLRRSF